MTWRGAATSSEAVAVKGADGSVVSGLGHSATQEAVVWTEAGGLHGLGILSGSSDALGISGDGNVIVGEGVYTSNVVGPFRSLRAGPIQAMPMLAGASPASGWAAGASYDGSVIVGQSRDSTGIQAVRWTSAGIAALGNMSGIATSEANGVSADGSVIVGGAFTASSDASAFRWTQGTGMQSIGYLGPSQGVDIRGGDRCGWQCNRRVQLSVDRAPGVPLDCSGRYGGAGGPARWDCVERCVRRKRRWVGDRGVELDWHQRAGVRVDAGPGDGAAASTRR